MNKKFFLFLPLISLVIFLQQCTPENNFDATNQVPVTVALKNADDKNGKTFYFFVYRHPMDSSSDYIGYNSFTIINGTGSANAFDRFTGAELKASDSITYDLFGSIKDSNGEIDLNPAARINYGTGYFGDCFPLMNNNLSALKAGTDFIYDQSFSNYDSKDNSAFDSQKYFRVTANSNNIAKTVASGGLNITPVAKDLTSFIAPPASSFYIDPARGKFALPRPVYWCKLENTDDVLNPSINTISSSTFSNPQNSVSISVFNSSNYKFNNNYNLTGVNVSGTGEERAIKPFGEFYVKGSQKFTVSFWTRVDNIADAYSFLRLYSITDSTKSIEFKCDYLLSGKILLNIDNGLKQSSSLPLGSWNLIYIEIDSGAIKIYLNGNSSPVISDTSSFDLSAGTKFIYGLGVTATNAKAYIDNVKIWDHIVSTSVNPASPNTSWLYTAENSGIEDALHLIYSATNYKPVNIQVGYYTNWPITGERYKKIQNINLSNGNASFDYLFFDTKN
jgi:Concanavalin A-like lectin/glucanases superfamily